MDVVSDAIAAVRIGQPSSNRVRVSGSWCARFAPYDGAGFHVVLEGSCWLLPDGGGPARSLAAGVFRGVGGGGCWLSPEGGGGGVPPAGGDAVLRPRGRGRVPADPPGAGGAGGGGGPSEPRPRAAAGGAPGAPADPARGGVEM